MITGQEQPDAGTLRIGDTVQMAYVDQSRDALDPDKTVWEEISGGMEQIKVGDAWMNSRAYTAGFNFKGSDQQKKVGKLSGGERNRLHLAKLLRTGGNLLLLDEPTNDLDVDTLRALEEALLSFAGCAVVISHDRWFLDRVATHVLAFEGDSQVTWFEGNFEAYEEHRRDAARRRGRPPAPHHLQEADADLARRARARLGALARRGGLLGGGAALGRVALARARGLLGRLAALAVAVEDAVADRVAGRAQVGERGLRERLGPLAVLGARAVRDGLGHLLAHAAGAQMVEEIVCLLVLGHGPVLPAGAAGNRRLAPASTAAEVRDRGLELRVGQVRRGAEAQQTPRLSVEHAARRRSAALQLAGVRRAQGEEAADALERRRRGRA